MAHDYRTGADTPQDAVCGRSLTTLFAATRQLAALQLRHRAALECSWSWSVSAAAEFAPLGRSRRRVACVEPAVRQARAGDPHSTRLPMVIGPILLSMHAAVEAKTSLHAWSFRRLFD